jgi:hypothetical protein
MPHRIGREGLVTALVLIGALIAFYSPWLFGACGFFDDQLYYAYPGANYLATSLDSGRFPLWICGLRGGMPFYTDLGMSVFYPPAWFLAFFVTGGKLSMVAFQWYMILHLFLGGIFISLLLKEMRCALLPRIIGALLFVFSGFMSLHIVHPSVIQTLIWIPLHLYLVSRIHHGASPTVYIGLVMSLAMSFFAGFPQVVVYASYLTAAYWLFLAFQNRQVSGSGAFRMIKVMTLELFKISGLMAASVMMVAVQYLPAAENWTLSQRQTFGFKEIADLSLPWYYLVHGLVPNIFGATAGDGGGVPFWGFNKDTLEYANWHGGAWMYWEFGFYAGQVAVIAVLALVFNVRRVWRAQREALFFLAVVPVVLLLMLGRYGGLFMLLYHVAPGFSMYRTPARIGCLLDLALSVLGAVLVNMLLRGEPKLNLKQPLTVMAVGYAIVISWFLFAGVSRFPELNNSTLMMNTFGQIGLSILLFLGMAACLVGVSRNTGGEANSKRSRIALLFLTGVASLVFLDLYSAFHRFHQAKVNPEEYFSDKNGLIAQMAQIREREGPFRFAQLRDGKISEEVVFPRNTGCFHQSYEGLEGLTLFTLRDYGVVSMKNEKARLDLQNVGVIANFDSSTRRVSLMRYTNSLPRAKFYGDVKVYEDANMISADLDAGRLDYRRTLGVLEEECVKYGVRTSPASAISDANIHFTQVSPEEYRVSYDTPVPGVVFISQRFYPGWEADNGRYPIIRAFGAFTGIVIPEAGAGVITVKFSPKVLWLGLAISGVSLSVAAGVLIVLLARSRRHDMRV